MKLVKGTLLAGAVGVCVAIFSPAGPTFNVAHAATKANFKTAVLSVKGMTCGGCSASVKTALKGVDGVDKVKVSQKDGKAQVSYDPSRTNPEALAQVVTQVGFETTPAK